MSVDEAQSGKHGVVGGYDMKIFPALSQYWLNVL